MKKYISQGLLITWLPLAVVITLVLGTVYGTVQQIYRQSANDPQIQLAEDGALLLSQGVATAQLIGSLAKVDVNRGLSTFALFFSESGQLIGSTGQLGTTTQAPPLPKGVLDSTRSMGENRVTWEIPTGQRFAAVAVHWKGNGPTNGQSGFILVARSLREVEDRELRLETMVFIAWIVTLIVSLASVWLRDYLRQKNQTV